MMSIKYKFFGRHPHVGRSLTPSGVPGQSRLVLTDGWMGDGWMGDGWTGGQAKSKKIMYFQHFSKTIRYFFLVVFWPPRRLLNTFSEKNSKKIKILKFVKKFRTTFFFQRFFRFFIKKSKFLKNYSIFFSSCFFAT